MSPRVGIVARRLIVFLSRTTRGENSAELVLATLAGKIFEVSVGDWVEVGGRDLSEAGGKLRCMSRPIVPDCGREHVESLYALAICNELALCTGRTQLHEAKDDHDRHDHGACTRHRSVTAEPARDGFNFAQAAKVIPEDSAGEHKDNEALGQEARGEFAAK